MTISSKEKILLFILALAVLLYFGLNYLVIPEISAWQKESFDTLQTENDLKEQTERASYVNAYNQRTNSALSKAEGSVSSLLPSLGGDVLNYWFNNFLDKDGLRLTSISFVKDAAETSGSSSSSKPSTLDDITAQINGTAAGSASSSSASGAAKSSSSSGSNADLVDSVAAQISCQGSYGSFEAFIDDMKNSGRAVIVTQAEATGLGNDDYAYFIKVECYGVRKLSGDGIFEWSSLKSGNVR